MAGEIIWMEKALPTIALNLPANSITSLLLIDRFWTKKKWLVHSEPVIIFVYVLLDMTFLETYPKAKKIPYFEYFKKILSRYINDFSITVYLQPMLTVSSPHLTKRLARLKLKK